MFISYRNQTKINIEQSFFASRRCKTLASAKGSELSGPQTIKSKMSSCLSSECYHNCVTSVALLVD